MSADEMHFTTWRFRVMKIGEKFVHDRHATSFVYWRQMTTSVACASIFHFGQILLTARFLRVSFAPARMPTRSRDGH